MGYFGKLRRKAKEKRPLKVDLPTDAGVLFDKINTKLEHSERFFGKLWKQATKKEDLKLDKKIPSDDSGTLTTNECILDESTNNNVFSMFTETFLQDKNQDCLEQALSFLTCKELAASAMTCKTLQHIIFESSDEEVHINMIWHGAEMELVKPHERLGYFEGQERFGANARDHCHLFMVASSTAKAYERSAEIGEIEEDRMMVDGVLANLMIVRGFDAESIAEKKAMAEAVTLTEEDDEYDEDEDDHDDDEYDEEEEDDDEYEDHDYDEEEDEYEEDEDLDSHDVNSDEDEYEEEDEDEDEESAMDVQHPESHDDDDSEDDIVAMVYERAQQYNETCEMLKEQTPPEKLSDHKVFVRIALASTGELICQGFCEHRQKVPWNSGLEMPFTSKPQGLEIMLNFDALKQSDEVEYYLKSLAEDVVDPDDPSLEFHVTAVVVSKNDFSCRCLFQQDQSKELKLSSTREASRFGNPYTRHSFGLRPTWGADTVQIGPSPYSHQYCLDFSLSLCTKDGGSCFMPCLEVDIRKDTSNIVKLALRRMVSQYIAGEISDEMMNAAMIGGIAILTL